MLHEEIWTNIIDLQEKILEKDLNDKDSYVVKAARDITEYREKLQKNGIEKDLIAKLSVLKAHDYGDGACKYGFDRDGDPYFDLEDKLNIIVENFKNNDIKDKELWSLLHDVLERASQVTI